MADRKDNINEQQAEQQAEQKLREEIREEMKNADQTPAEEHYSLTTAALRFFLPVCWWPSALSATVWLLPAWSS